MRFYFLSERPAALKLNGAYMGLIDGFEKFAEIDPSQKILAEAIPDGDGEPLSFFIDDSLFQAPPEFIDLYSADDCAVIFISRYPPRSHPLKVVAQTTFYGNLVTLFLNGGGIYLNVQAKESALYELARGFENAKFTERTVGGFPVLTVEGDGVLAIISTAGKRVFYNPAESFDCGEVLTVTVKFNTCAACRAKCQFAYDGEKMSLTGSTTEESFPPDESVYHFAFFESVLTRGDFKKYLCEELSPSADALPGYLGEFVDVIIPHSQFFEKHGEIKAVGLVYPLSRNLFKVKYYAVDMQDKKISNIYEVE